MIVKKLWMKIDRKNHDLYKYANSAKEMHYEGWFLFGLIPLYIRQTKVTYS